MEELIEEIKTNVIQGRVTSEDEGFDEGYEGQPATVELVEEAIEKGVDVKKLIVEGLTGAMDVVGQNFESGTYLIPDMLASAEAVGEAMDILSPHLEGAGMESKGKVVIATVKGDLHDIGKNIVSTMLKGAGFAIVDLGTDVPTDKIVQSVKDNNPKFLGLSALLTTTMREMEGVISSLKDEGLREKVKVLIGGAPTSQEFAEKIGADAHCADAFQAVDYANSAKN
ncbi:MAG: corrinoid protein [Nitrospirota bacterium]|jgi:5-methyltetrahydrofolate--homocysteine methyltransferase